MTSLFFIAKTVAVFEGGNETVEWDAVAYCHCAALSHGWKDKAKTRFAAVSLDWGLFW